MIFKRVELEPEEAEESEVEITKKVLLVYVKDLALKMDTWYLDGGLLSMGSQSLTQRLSSSSTYTPCLE